MARCQYSRPQENVSITRSMPAPKKYTDLDAWVKEARKVIPEIPIWPHYAEIVTDKTIVFKLIEPKTRDKCALVIDRTPS